MIGLVVRRLAAMVPLLLFVSFVVFSLVTLVPGDAATTLAGGTDASVEDIEQIQAELNLDDPFIVQYGKWLGGAIHGDFGNSLLSGRPVWGELKRAIPPTLGLVAATLILVIPVALLLGLVSGLRPGSVRDKTVLTFTSASIAMPSFWVALLLVSLFAVRLQWLPPLGYESFFDGPWEWAKHMIMPAIALSVSAIAVVSRQLRGGLADTMSAPYIRTAWAKGGGSRQVIAGHALEERGHAGGDRARPADGGAPRRQHHRRADLLDPGARHLPAAGDRPAGPAGDPGGRAPVRGRQRADQPDRRSRLRLPQPEGACSMSIRPTPQEAR